MIDELDSGIYEYLLGECLEVMQDKAKGQLIFTSHNLRPLEILENDSLLYTTVNPENCYIKSSITQIKLLIVSVSGIMNLINTFYGGQLCQHYLIV